VTTPSERFKRQFLKRLRAAHKAGCLKFFGEHEHLADRKAFTAYLAPLKKTRWYVNTKRPFAGPRQVLAYLSRYTHRVAISNSRLIAIDNEASPSNTRTTGSKAANATRP
jgi:hypothetical protein